MSDYITIALDAMGGDDAPAIVIEGAGRMARRKKDIRFLFFGDEKRIRPLVEKDKDLLAISSLVHTDEWVDNDTKPSHAVRRLKKSSMRLAIRSVREGRADAVVCAGNTGALMALSKMELKTLAGVSRPAIASFLPTRKSRCLVLDLGANAQCDAYHLVQFAMMGEIYSRHVANIAVPRVRLLNIGSEDSKGQDHIRAAADMLRQKDGIVHFAGYIEGDGIAAGDADVVVTDGFSGNVMLKSVEGYTRFIFHLLRRAISSSLTGRIIAPLLFPVFRRLRRDFDPRAYNGAMLLGLNGIVVKSHGGTDGFGFSRAISVAFDLVKGNYARRLGDELKNLPYRGDEKSVDPKAPMPMVADNGPKQKIEGSAPGTPSP